MLCFRVVQSFLNAQHKVWPMVFASVIASYLANPLLLKLLVPLLALNGSALAISCTQWVMLGALCLFVRFQHESFRPETWPGISKSVLLQAIQQKPMTGFFVLSLGGVLSLSEWWFWETICFMVGTLGVVPLVCHTIAYNLVPLLYMPCLGIVMGLSIRLGHVVMHDVRKAKVLAAWSMLFASLFGGFVAVGLLCFRLPICKLFTKDDEVIQGSKAIWSKLCIYVFILHIFGINSAIVRALGMQWRMALIIFLCLWFGALPALWYHAVHLDGGLQVVWTVLPASYGIMQILLIASYVTVDWKEMATVSHPSDEHSELPACDSDTLAPKEYHHLLFEPSSASYM
jgi:Na+-driven multidrug efflux pump